MCTYIRAHNPQVNIFHIKKKKKKEEEKKNIFYFFDRVSSFNNQDTNQFFCIDKDGTHLKNNMLMYIYIQKIREAHTHQRTI